jgi:glutathione S-transferase
MIKIYHAGSSVCSQKVRIMLAEKDIPWDSMDIDLAKGEQFSPDYLALNPEGVVPTLVAEDGQVVRESSVILEYLDQMRPDNQLMPTDLNALYDTKLWLIRTIEIHAAINSMTFATVIRDKVKSSMTPEQIEGWLVGKLGPQISAKRRDLMDSGATSVFVDGALHTLTGMLRDMNTALEKHSWLSGEDYALADIALFAYIERLDRLAMAGLWQGRFPKIADWLERCQARPSYQSGIVKYYPAEVTAAYRKSGDAAWPVIKQRLPAV